MENTRAEEKSSPSATNEFKKGEEKPEKEKITQTRTRAENEQYKYQTI